MKPIAKFITVALTAFIVAQGVFSSLARPAAADNTSKLVIGQVENRRMLSEFKKPAPTPAKLRFTVAELAGRKITWEDQFSKGTATLSADGTFRYSDDAGNNGIAGLWWVDPKGALCLTTPDFWFGGQCWDLHGSRTAGLQYMHQHREFDTWFPASFGN